MKKTKINMIWACSGILLFFILLNVAFFKIAGTNIEKVFFGLLTAIIFSAWMIYIIRPKKILSMLGSFIRKNELLSKVPVIKWLPNHIEQQMMDEQSLQVSVGNQRCKQPYRSAIFNTAAYNDVVSKIANSHLLNTTNDLESEDDYGNSNRMDTYRINGEGLVGQVGPSYNGCRSSCGNFNPVLFKSNAMHPSIKMIELKLTEYTAAADTAIFAGNGSFLNNVVPVAEHTAFNCAESMMIFIGSLQKLSGGKPVGIRLSISDKKKFYEICFAIRKTRIFPDFISVQETVDAGIKTNTANKSMPLYEALQFVSKTLKQYGLQKEIKIMAITKKSSGFELIKLIALGADTVCTFLPAHKIEKRRAGSNTDYRNKALQSMIGIMQACGFRNPKDITLEKLFRRLDMLPLIAQGANGDENENGGKLKILRQHDEKYRRKIDRKQEAIM